MKKVLDCLENNEWNSGRQHFIFSADGQQEHLPFVSTVLEWMLKGESLRKVASVHLTDVKVPLTGPCSRYSNELFFIFNVILEIRSLYLILY
jgi:hypothetical protein